MAGYIGAKAVGLNVTTGDILGDVGVGGDIDVNGGAVFNEGSADVDFRVESNGNSNMLFVNGGNDKVGIGTNAPEEQFSVQDANGGIVFLGRTSGTTTGLLGRIEMGNTDVDSALGGIDFTQDGATNSSRIGFFTQAAGAAAAERMRITSAGNVGIGTAAPSFANGTGLEVRYAGGNGAHLKLTDAASGAGGSNGFDLYAFNTNGYVENFEAGSIVFRNNGDERMRIDNNGFIDMGPQSGSGVGRLNVSANPNNNYLAQWWNTSGATVGHVVVSGGGSATTYATSSDYRLKTDAKPMTGASDRVLALKPVNFAWKTGGSRVDGFLAHEAQAVVPECVTGTKDAMMDEEYEVTPAVLDDDGNETKKAVMGTRSVPDFQGIDQSKIVPLLVAALQEALARITVLENG